MGVAFGCKTDVFLLEMGAKYNLRSEQHQALEIAQRIDLHLNFGKEREKSPFTCKSLGLCSPEAAGVEYAGLWFPIVSSGFYAGVTAESRVTIG